MSKAGEIADAVLNKLAEYKGFDWWWDEIQEQDKTEIFDDITKVVEERLK